MKNTLLWFGSSILNLLAILDQRTITFALGFIVSILAIINYLLQIRKNSTAEDRNKVKRIKENLKVMFKFNKKNIVKAGLSSLLGGLILVLTPTIELLATGSIVWKHVGYAAIAAGVLAVTDVFKEIKKEIDEQN